MDENTIDVLDVLYRMIETDRAFLQTLRFLNVNREQLLVNQQRNTASLLALLRTHVVSGGSTITIPITLPQGMTLPASWEDPVIVRPTATQIARATTVMPTPLVDTNCSICQDSLAEPGTRITHCGHVFHMNCITEWFSRSVFCPMCRHDIREADHPAPTSSVPVDMTPPVSNPWGAWLGGGHQTDHTEDTEGSDEHHA